MRNTFAYLVSSYERICKLHGVNTFLALWALIATSFHLPIPNAFCG